MDGEGATGSGRAGSDPLGTPQAFDRVLSSMCTEPHPAARRAAERFLASNPGDPETYQQVAALERAVVDRLGTVADLDDPAGYVTSGGTEANLQALHIARNRAATTTPNVVVPTSAHFSFDKAASILGLDLRRVPTADRRADPAAMAAATDADTVAVVAVAGSTEYGRIDPIPAVAEVAAEVDALTHVDAAFGGFCLPFTDHDWSFADAAVDTLTIDPHKMGRAAIPAGGLLARSSGLLSELAVDTPYLESDSQASLTGTRSGAGVASAFAAMEALWPAGYREQFADCLAVAERLADGLAARGYPVVEPELPVVAADLPAGTIESLRERGWRVARTSDDELRIVCMPHVTDAVAAAFLEDVPDATT
jgi:tyrosine decarboxylase/aspartate 1-decarboxylase